MRSRARRSRASVTKVWQGAQPGDGNPLGGPDRGENEGQALISSPLNRALETGVLLARRATRRATGGMLMNDQSRAWQHWFPLIENAVGDLSHCMFDQVGLAPGHRVLDLATGIGEPALEAARRVGPEGWVLGVDISPAMIDMARARAEAAGLTNAEFRVMDIGALSHLESFDIVLSRCGLMFVDDLRATLVGIWRVLEPGGRISMSFWASGDETPTLSLAERTAHRVLGLPPPDEGEKTPFALCDAAATAATLEEAGFADVRMQRVTVTFEFQSAAQFVSYRQALSSRFVAPMNGRSDRARENILKAVDEAITPYQVADGTVRMENRAYCLSAVRPVIPG